ncbi:hypothetical protein F4604DRAFT_1902669 [Suillus subluteus]|nr:hypothetical protein F4604DRAFT_1902669 [Suillus subluteus]
MGLFSVTMSFDPLFRLGTTRVSLLLSNHVLLVIPRSHLSLLQHTQLALAQPLQCCMQAYGAVASFLSTACTLRNVWNQETESLDLLAGDRRGEIDYCRIEDQSDVVAAITGHFDIQVTVMF